MSKMMQHKKINFGEKLIKNIFRNKNKHSLCVVKKIKKP